MVESDYVRALSSRFLDIGFMLAIYLLIIIFCNLDGEILAVFFNNYSESD